MSSDPSLPVPQNQAQGQTPAPVPSWGRQFRQLGLLLTGAGFMAASVAVTRRSVVRRQLSSIPKFYVSNRNPINFDSSDRSLLAVHALGLATLNVMSFGIMLIGGVSWAFDISSPRELQIRTREAVRRKGTVNPEEEAELEKMMGDLMARFGMQVQDEAEKKEETTLKDSKSD